MTSATNYPFPKCVNQHDLSGSDAFIYDSSGNRKCRVCVSESGKKKGKERSVRGAFDG